MSRKDLQEKLESLITRRDRFKVDLERKKGRLEEAERRMKGLEDKLREKNIDPKNLKEIVQKLETEFEQKLETFEQGLDTLGEKLSGISVE